MLTINETLTQGAVEISVSNFLTFELQFDHHKNVSVINRSFSADPVPPLFTVRHNFKASIQVFKLADEYESRTALLTAVVKVTNALSQKNTASLYAKH